MAGTVLRHHLSTLLHRAVSGGIAAVLMGSAACTREPLPGAPDAPSPSSVPAAASPQLASSSVATAERAQQPDRWDGCPEGRRGSVHEVLAGAALDAAVAELDQSVEADSTLERLRQALGLQCARGTRGLHAEAAQVIASFQTRYSRSLREVTGLLDDRTLRYLAMVYPALRGSDSACGRGEGAELTNAGLTSFDGAPAPVLRRFQQWVHAARPAVVPTGLADEPTREAWQSAYSAGQGHLPSCLLRWEGATDDQLRFMRTVYEVQRIRAAQKREYVDGTGEVGEIEDGKEASRAAALACRGLLTAIRAERAQKAGAGGKADLVVVTAYRSAPFQLEMWEYHFPARYASTARRRAGMRGGEHGDEAAMMMADYFAARTASPGYSLHNRGVAVDFGCVLRDGRLVGATGQFIPAWRRSWCLGWLKDRAAAFGFRPNREIDEPWHWEYEAPQR